MELSTFEPGDPSDLMGLGIQKWQPSPEELSSEMNFLGQVGSQGQSPSPTKIGHREPLLTPQTEIIQCTPIKRNFFKLKTLGGLGEITETSPREEETPRRPKSTRTLSSKGRGSHKWSIKRSERLNSAESQVSVMSEDNDENDWSTAKIIKNLASTTRYHSYQNIETRPVTKKPLITSIANLEQTMSQRREIPISQRTVPSLRNILSPNPDRPIPPKHRTSQTMTSDLKATLPPHVETVVIKRTSNTSQHFLNPSGLYMHVPLSKSQVILKTAPTPRTQPMLTISSGNFNNKITELNCKIFWEHAFVFFGRTKC